MYIILVSNYHGCKEQAINLINIRLFDRYYSQNLKAITFLKNTNHAKVKNLNKYINVPGHLDIF